MDSQMERTWQWLFVALDSLEAQLATGVRVSSANAALMQSSRAQDQAGASGAGAAGAASSQAGVISMQAGSDGMLRRSGRGLVSRSRHRVAELDEDGNPRPAASAASSSAAAAPSFRHYLLSLMRGHSGEHGDTLPAIDIARCRHLAFALDAFMYYIKRWHPQSADAAHLQRASARPFFLRSESIATGGAADPRFDTPMRDALPLAERPDRLLPTSSKTTLFGSARDRDRDRQADVSAFSTRSTPSHLGGFGR